MASLLPGHPPLFFFLFLTLPRGRISSEDLASELKSQCSEINPLTECDLLLSERVDPSEVTEVCCSIAIFSLPSTTAHQESAIGEKFSKQGALRDTFILGIASGLLMHAPLTAEPLQVHGMNSTIQVMVHSAAPSISEEVLLELSPSPFPLQSDPAVASNLQLLYG